MEINGVKGIVLKSVDYKDKDKILTLATDNLGKITVMAKGLKNMNSKLATGLAPLTLSELDLIKNDDFYIVTQASKICDFKDIALNIEHFSYAGYILELSNDLFLEEEPFLSLFNLLLNTLYLISKNKMDIRQIKAVFELRAMFLSGYAIDAHCCDACGESKIAAYLDLEEGMTYCEDCGKQGIGLKHLSNGASKALCYLLSSDDRKVFSFKAGESLILELSDISEKYVASCMQKEYKSLNYLKKVVGFSDTVNN